MSSQPAHADRENFSDVKKRLQAIVDEVRAKDVSLEHSLELFDEAIALGSKAVRMVDATDFSAEEKAALDESKIPEAALESSVLGEDVEIHNNEAAGITGVKAIGSPAAVGNTAIDPEDRGMEATRASAAAQYAALSELPSYGSPAAIGSAAPEVQPRRRI